jgi:hypothetical protein
MEWGPHIGVLTRAKEKGMNPQALIDKPDIEWYYEVFISHFNVLSFSRTRRPSIRITSKGGKIYTTDPNPLDLPSIILYNREIVKMESCADFISIIQALDSVYVQHSHKQRG